MKLLIQSRSGKQVVPGGLEVADGATVDDLKSAFFSLKKSYYPERQRFSLPPAAGEKRGIALADGKKLSDFGVTDGSVLYFKDLGPQVGWTTVFFWEYYGPLMVYPLFYFFPNVFYPGYSIPSKAKVQTAALAFWTFHYTKRILETFLVHRFSHSTMPLFNLFKNCGYYWLFAAYVSYFINHPLYTAPSWTQSNVALVIAVLFQLSNFWTHIILKNLRPPGSKEYAIPKGFLFNFVTCANYTTEIYAWLAFSIGTQTLAAMLFTAAGTIQMIPWAMAKHRRLRKLFDGQEGRPKFKRPFIILPPFL